MLILPDPLSSHIFSESPRPASSPAMLADHVARLERTAARRARVFAGLAFTPTRWHRPEPRPSVQYAGHMATAAARDHRLTPQSKALLTVLRARCGNGTATATCKTTLAHIMGVCTRSIGRYVRELVRFGYIETRTRTGSSGLHVGLAVVITEKVLPCFRKSAWLAGWLAANLPATGANPGRTELSHTNHSQKESSSPGRFRPEQTP